MEEEIKTYYNFEINDVDYFFDDELCYNLNNEKISDLHLLQFSFPDKVFHVLISTKNNGFIDYGSESSITSFLIDRGVSYKPYDCADYEFLRAPDRIKVTLKDGEKFILEMKYPHYFRAGNLFKYSVPNFKINFNKTMRKEVVEKRSIEHSDGEIPESLKKYLSKKKNKEIISLLIFLAITALFFYLL